MFGPIILFYRVLYLIHLQQSPKIIIFFTKFSGERLKNESGAPSPIPVLKLTNQIQFKRGGGDPPLKPTISSVRVLQVYAEHPKKLS